MKKILKDNYNLFRCLARNSVYLAATALRKLLCPFYYAKTLILGLKNHNKHIF